MKKLLFALPFTCLLSLYTSAQYQNNVSEFADKPADSYANFKNADGSPGVLIWGKAPLTDFGSRTFTMQPKGIRTLTQAPPPGVHPRIYFGPSELEEVRARVKNTRCGQAAWKNILCWTEMMKGRYNDKADYAQPDYQKGTFGGLHGRVPLYRLSIPRTKEAAYNQHPLAAATYKSLIDGTATNFPAYYWNTFSLEAFRCLIDNDAAAATQLASAVMTAMKIDQAKRDSVRAAKHITKPNEQPVGVAQLAFTYDFIYAWLSPEQKKAIHEELANCSWSHDNYGTFNGAESSRGNWATFSYWLHQVLSIEGEPGFNDLKVKGMYRGWRNLFTYGWFESGATYEGEAKNQLGMDGIIPFAKRQQMYGFDNLAAHPHLQAYAQNFLPHSVIPSQNGFIRYDLLGGSRSKVGTPNVCDLLGLKYLFPNDKRIDWVYRLLVKDDYSNVPDRPDGYFNALLFFAVFATDFDADNNNPEALQLPNTFFCGERALIMTRSNWNSKDALMLNMHTRQANGGHPFADRNAIMVAGAGRVWSPVQYNAFENSKQSVLTIDYKKQSEITPGQMLAFKDSLFATFCTGSTKYVWDWNNMEREKPGGKGYYTVEDVLQNKIDYPKNGNWELEPNTTNYFSYLKLPYPYLNVPRSQTPHWVLPKGAIRPFLRQPNYPVQYALRTAGIVRSTNAYALVMDDMAKDSALHHYDWVLTLEHDVQIWKTTKQKDGQLDILLTGNDPDQLEGWGKDSLPALYNGIPANNQAMLLVRVLNYNNQNDTLQPVINEWRATAPKAKDLPVRRLVIGADASKAAYKVMLLPYRYGMALPVTTWNKQRTLLTVKWSDGRSEVIDFSKCTNGNQRFSISQNKQTFYY